MHEAAASAASTAAADATAWHPSSTLRWWRRSHTAPRGTLPPPLTAERRSDAKLDGAWAVVAALARLLRRGERRATAPPERFRPAGNDVRVEGERMFATTAAALVPQGSSFPSLIEACGKLERSELSLRRRTENMNRSSF